MDIQSNELKKEIQELRKENLENKSNHNHSNEMDNPSKDNQFNELKKEIQELRKENFQLELKLESLSEMIWNCFEQLGQKPDKDVKNLKEEIMYSKD